ncbi:MAG: hypothetical protein CFE23_14060 [Flavobacterium sp. BFFFF1]|uniref:hypothetical protein n=1 Tax=Flavobacterium sp. BFFFF1 TaxID=2015557 RepID=UPI000BDA00C4|nr:hypothetical protein [Flavobacterium sp. BFFFF1]OYU79420.1 MAG: hypothetical protein CFE23_14060 [Flavobacterium sp. BFFFF1]
MKIKCLLLGLLIFGKINAQSVSAENVSFQMLQQPKEVIDANSRTFRVTVTSPYNLTADDVIRQSKEDFKNEQANYTQTVANSEKEFQQKLKDYDNDVIKAKEKFALESEEFKKLSALERLAMTSENKNPKLVLPNKPEYVKPAPPVYREPNLNDYTIMDNNVLASQININGFTREGSTVDIILDIKNVNFQDNAGQTYANQPTKMVIKVNGTEKINKTFFTEYAFISSSPSNNINKPAQEKAHLNKVIQFLNDFINEQYGFITVSKSVKIQSVKNKGKYDDLARADIYVTTNLKKLQPMDKEVNDMALSNMQKGIDIWTQTLEKIEYKNPKADFNAKIAEFIYFNLIRLNLALNNKKDAEKYLNQFQENQIYMKLSSDDERELNSLETQVYRK